MSSHLRIKSFDLLKLFAIFLVIWGHVIQYLLPSYHRDDVVWRCIYSFHMPLFMMISGYFSFSSMRLPFMAFIKKKFIQLILPCITWSILIWGGQILLNANVSIRSIIYRLFFSFWFLRSCFICYIIAWIGSNSRLKLKYWGPLTLVTSQFLIGPKELDGDFNIPLMYLCFFIGVLLRCYDFLMMLVTKYNVVLILLFFVMLMYWGTHFFGLTFMGAIGDLTNGDITTICLLIYRYSIGLVGSLAFIGLFNSYFYKESSNSSNKKLNLFCGWGQLTLGIYLTQTLLLQMILPNYIQFSSIDSIWFSLIIAPFISCIILSVCVLIVKLLLHSHILGFAMLGRYNYKN